MGGTGSAWADEVTLFSTDFSDASWSNVTFSQGNTDSPDVFNDITFYSKHASNKFSLSDGKLTFPNNLAANNYFMAIPVTGVNGSLTITVANGNTATRIKYDVKEGAEYTTSGIDNNTATDAANPTTVTKSDLTGTNYVVYIGRQGSGYTSISSITITTPSGDSPTTYALSYNLLGHGDAIDGANVSALPNPLPTPTAHAGYAFGGWYTGSNCATAATAGASISETTTLYAKWTTTGVPVNTESIFSLTANHTSAVKISNQNGEITDFSAYSVSTSGGTIDKIHNGRNGEAEVLNTSGINLSGSSASYIQLTLDQNLQAGDVIHIPTTAGVYKLSKSASTSSVVYTASDGYYIVKEGDVLIGQKNIYIWKEGASIVKTVEVLREVTKFTVTFNAGSNGACTTSNLTETSEGAGVVLPKATVNDGYKFVGWSTSATPASADAGEASATYYPTGNCTLYAYYTELLPATISVTGGGTYNVGDVITLTGTPTATNGGTIYGVSGFSNGAAYRWKSCNEDGSNLRDIGGETKLSFTPSSSTAGTYYYRFMCVENVDGTSGFKSTLSDVITVVVKVPTIGKEDCTNTWADNVTSDAFPLQDGKTVTFSFTNGNDTGKESYFNWNVITSDADNRSESANFTTQFRCDGEYNDKSVGDVWGPANKSANWTGDYSQTNMHNAHVVVKVSRFGNVVNYYAIVTLADGKIVTTDWAKDYTAKVPAYAWLRVDKSYITNLSVSTDDITYRTITVNKKGEGEVVAKVKSTGAVILDGRVVDGTTMTFSNTPETWYQFDNWHDGSGYIVTPTFEKCIASDLNLGANFIRYYQIQTAATNGSVSLKIRDTETVVTADTKIKKGTALTATATPAAGYRFVRWELTGAINSTSETNPNLTVNKIEDFLGPTTQALATLTAVFESDVVTHTITFNGNSATAGEMAAQVVTDGVETAINANTFTRSHYTFAGWNTKSDGSGTDYANNANITLTKDITLYAKWTKNVYTCTVAVNDVSYGSATVNGDATSASIAYNDKAHYVATPNDGYRFVNWTDESDNVVETKADFTTGGVGSGLHYTANFAEETKIETTVAHTWDLTSLTISSSDNDGEISGENYALYWNTQAGTVKDTAEGDNMGLAGLKINSVSDTYIVIPAHATGVLKVTFAPRKKDQETGIAINGKDAVLYDGGTAYNSDGSIKTYGVKEFSFNVANETEESMKVSIKRATSTAREGVITQIVWTPLQISDLKKKNAVTMLVGHDYINTAQLTKDTHYTTSSTGGLTYTSNNTDIVTVDANGLLTAKKAGITTVTISQAATFDYAAGTCDVTVNVNDLYASSNALEVQTNNNKTVTLSSTSTGAYTVTSKNAGIATADLENGIVTIQGVAEGETTITVNQLAVSGFPAASITIAVSVYNTKAYYDATGGNLKFEKSIIDGENFMTLGGVGFSKKSYTYEGENQKDKQIYDIKTTSHVMKINVQNAAAFEIFTVGGTGRTYFMNVDGQNVGIVSAESGTTSSGVFPCNNTGSTITLTGNGNDVYPAYIKFYNVLPTIIKVDGRSGFDNVTQFVDGGAVAFSVETNNDVSEMTLTDVNPEIATVTLSEGTLTVTPVKAGSFTMMLAQAAVGETQTAGSRPINVNIKKHALKLSYDKSQISIDKNSNPSATLTEAATLSCTIDGVATAMSDLSTKGVTLTYDSDDHNVATVASDGSVSLATNPQGIATITASIDNNNNYSVTSATHKIAVIDGYNFKMPTTGTESKINNLYPIYGDGEEEADNILAGIYYGGWKYDKKYSSDELADSKWITDGKEVDTKGHKVITDSWPTSKEYSRAGISEKIYIDGYQQQTQANNNARSENVEHFEIGKPFSLPVRGAYMKFDAERTGVMTAYFVQNGDLDYDGETLKAGFARRSYFITDEFGNIVTPISAMSKEKLPAQDEVINRSCGGNTANYPNYAKALADQCLAEDGTGLKSWTWNTTERQPVLYDTDTKGYHVLQKAYVKYVFNVEAGKSYYVFSSSSKIGFAGANFQVSDAANLTGRNIAHEAELNLDQTQTYVAPTQKTWYDRVTLNRSFKPGEWSTITLPFSLCESKVKEIFGEGSQLTVFNGVDGSTVNFFYHVDQNIIAGYPYIIYPTKEVESIEVQNVTIDPTVPQYVFSNENEGGHPHWVNDGCQYVFKGLDGYSKASAKEAMCKYSYYMSADGLHRTTSGTLTSNGYRAYLKYVGLEGSPAPAKFAKISTRGIEERLDDNTTTGIMAALEAEDLYEPTVARGVYNLNGQKVADSVKGLPAGIYIVNGKKVVVNK